MPLCACVSHTHARTPPTYPITPILSQNSLDAERALDTLNFSKILGMVAVTRKANNSILSTPHHIPTLSHRQAVPDHVVQA